MQPKQCGSVCVCVFESLQFCIGALIVGAKVANKRVE